MHKKNLLLTTGFRQTFIQHEMQKSKSQVEERNLKVHRRGSGWKVNGYALLYTIIDVKICYIYRVNTMR
jgi:hypothetical protein